MNILKNIFTNDKSVMLVILLYAVVLFLEECNVSFEFLATLDIACTKLTPASLKRERLF